MNKSAQFFGNYFKQLTIKAIEGVIGGILMSIDIDCGLTNTVQGVDLLLYRMICTTNESRVSADIKEGEKIAARRAKVIEILNSSLGMQFSADSIVITNCSRADDGICVISPNEGLMTYSMDIFRPFDKSRYQYIIARHCLINSSYNPLDPPPYASEEEQNCIYQYSGPPFPELRGDVVSTINKIERVRILDTIAGKFCDVIEFIRSFVASVAIFFGIAISESEEKTQNLSRPNYPKDGFPLGGGDGGNISAINPMPENTITPHPTIILGDDGRTAGQ